MSTTPLSTLSRLWDVEVKSLWVRVQEPTEGQQWPQLRGPRTPPPRHLPRPAGRATVSTGGGLVPPPAVPVAVTTPPAGLARPGWRRRELRTACDLPRRRGGTHPGCSPPSGRAPNRGNGPRSLGRDGGPPARCGPTGCGSPRAAHLGTATATDSRAESGVPVLACPAHAQPRLHRSPSSAPEPNRSARVRERRRELPGTE